MLKILLITSTLLLMMGSQVHALVSDISNHSETTAPCETCILTVAFESSGESLLAQTYVTRVIKVRAAERGKTSHEIVLAPYQFSCWNKGMKLKKRTGRELYRARQACEAADHLDVKVNLYHDNRVKPRWTRSKRVKFVRKIGKLSFYYEKK